MLGSSNAEPRIAATRKQRGRAVGTAGGLGHVRAEVAGRLEQAGEKPDLVRQRGVQVLSVGGVRVAPARHADARGATLGRRAEGEPHQETRTRQSPDVRRADRGIVHTARCRASPDRPTDVGAAYVGPLDCGMNDESEGAERQPEHSGNNAVHGSNLAVTAPARERAS
jgi:hypothetical protein